MPRPQVNGGVATPQISPTASPVGIAIPNFSELARGYKAPGTDIAETLGALSPSLRQALAYGAEGYNEREAAAGQAAFQDSARDTKTLDELASLVAAKKIDETQSPAFRRAFREAAATEFAQRYHVEVSKRIQDEIQRQRSVPTDTGVSPALEPKTAAQIQAEVYGSLAEKIPGLLGSVQARARLGNLIATSNSQTDSEYAKAHEEVKREYTRNAVATSLSLRMKALSEASVGGALPEEALTELSQIVTDEVYRNSIAEPSVLYFQAASAAANQLASVGGLENIQAALRFAESAAKVKIGNLTASSDNRTADKWSTLIKQLDAAAQQEAQQDEISGAKRDRAVRDSVYALIAGPLAEGKLDPTHPNINETLQALRGQIATGPEFTSMRDRGYARTQLDAILSSYSLSKTELGQAADDANTRASRAASVNGDFEKAEAHLRLIADPQKQEVARQHLQRDVETFNTVEQDPAVKPILATFNGFDENFRREFDGIVPDSYITATEAAREEIQAYNRTILAPAILARRNPGGEENFRKALAGLKEVRDKALAPVTAIAESRREAEAAAARLQASRTLPTKEFDAALKAGIIPQDFVSTLTSKIQTARTTVEVQKQQIGRDVTELALRTASTYLGEQNTAVGTQRTLEYVADLEKRFAKQLEEAGNSPDATAALFGVAATMREKVRQEIPGIIQDSEDSASAATALALGKKLSVKEAALAAERVSVNNAQSSRVFFATARLEAPDIASALTGGKEPPFKDRSQASAIARYANAQHYSGAAPWRRTAAFAEAMANRAALVSDAAESAGGGGPSATAAAVEGAVGYGIHYTEILSKKISAESGARAEEVAKEYQERFGESIESLPLFLGSSNMRYVPSGAKNAEGKAALLRAYSVLKNAKSPEVPLDDAAIRAIDWARTPLFRDYAELNALRHGFVNNEPEAMETVRKIGVAFGFLSNEDQDMNRNGGLSALWQAQASLFGETFKK